MFLLVIFIIFLYLSSIYPCSQILQRYLNGHHDSERVIVGMRGLDRIRKFRFFRTSDMMTLYQIKINTNVLAFKTVQYLSLLSINKLVVETYIRQ